MKKYCIGDKFQIQCYKHNGNIHRSWDEAILLDINKDYLVFGNNHTKVTESNGSVRRTREPAVMYYFKNEWFNIIAQLKKDGIYYFCNIASPSIIEDNTIKYIDYDLDLRIFADGTYKILDKLEYEHHRRTMNYSYKLDKVVKNAMTKLISIYENDEIYFDNKVNYAYYKIYVNEKEKSNYFN
jgi:hypothetical protein